LNIQGAWNLKLKIVAVFIIVFYFLGIVLYAYMQNGLNDCILAARQIETGSSGGWISSLSGYPPTSINSDVIVEFKIDLIVVNPSSKYLTIPPFTLTIYIDNNSIGDVSTPQFSLSPYVDYKDLTLNLTVDIPVSQLASKYFLYNLIGEYWSGYDVIVTFRIIGTTYIPVSFLFLSNTVSIPVDDSKTVDLFKRP
jgi:hypothetical protein